MCMHVQAAPNLSFSGYAGMSAMLFLMPLGMLLCIAVVAVIIWVLIRAVRKSVRSSGSPTPYSFYRGQGEDTLFRDGPPVVQGRQDEPPASSSYEQPQAQYPEMHQHH